MKKLLIIASAVMFACVAQAASFTWGFSSDSIEDSSGNYIDGGTAFLYLGTVTASSSSFDLSSATLLATAGQDAANYNFGVFDSSNPATSDALAATTAGQAYSLILVENAGVTTLAGYEGNYILSVGSSGEDTDPMSGLKWATFVDTATYTSANWSPMGGAVPEPTSGLLLLLGMAGLALKRKHA